jgi:caa(3)-type oxidase subunit IV
MSDAREAMAAVAPEAAHGEGGAPAARPHHEPLPVSVYLGVAAALFVLTGITVAVAQVDFGEWNTVVAMLVASVKASLVVLYFMNLKHDPDRMNRVVFLAAMLFLVLYATFTLADHLTRGRLDPVRGQPAPIPARFVLPGAEAAGTAGAAAPGAEKPAEAAPAGAVPPGTAPAAGGASDPAGVQPGGATPGR